MKMKGKIIPVILITIILIGVGFIAYSLLAEDVGPIPPNNGNGNGTPSTSIFINSPIDHYVIPSTGPWHHINVNIEVKDITSTHTIELSWHDGIDYDKKEWEVSSSGTYTKTMLIQRLASGSHSLSAKLYKGSTLVDEDTIHIEIPDTYIYSWNSNDVSICPECVYSEQWYYAFTFPYMQDGTMYYLRGKMTRVKGQIYMGVTSYCLNNRLIVYLGVMATSAWNTNTEQWTMMREDYVVDLCDGVPNCPCDWDGRRTIYETANFDFSLNNIWGNEIAFATHEICIMDNFIGQVFFKPGTYVYQESPLDIIMSVFGADDYNNPPHPRE